MSKKYHFWAQLVQKRGHDGPRLNKTVFFAEQNFSAEIKPDHKLSEL